MTFYSRVYNGKPQTIEPIDLVKGAFAAGDVDLDGSITTSNAVAVLRASAGFDDDNNIGKNF